MKTSIRLLAVALAILTWIVLTLERRIMVLERTKMDYDIHFGYKSHFPTIGEFGVYEKRGGAKCGN